MRSPATSIGSETSSTSTSDPSFLVRLLKALTRSPDTAARL
jgi:hypothetical protein